MTLVAPADVKALISTSLTDAQLQQVIERVEAKVIRRYGPHYSASTTVVTETLYGLTQSLYMRRRLASISAITEYQTLDALTGSALTTTAWHLRGDEGRIQRMPEGARWGSRVLTVYTPEDDSQQRRDVIIKLVRLSLERTGMKSESIAGEYSYTAPDWERAEAEILDELGFIPL